MPPADIRRSVQGGFSFEPNLKVDPLEFWQNIDNRKRFPILARVVRKILAVQGSLASPERLFSFTGLRMSKLQSKKDDLAICADVIVAKQGFFLRRARKEE